MSKITLNFFGEKSNIERPESLLALKTQIAQIFCFTLEDATEILLTYKDEGGDKVLISTDEDLKTFLESKVDTIDLDISQESKLFKENLNQLKEESLNDQKELDKLLKKKDELEKIKNDKINSGKDKMKEIHERIKALLTEKRKMRFEHLNELKKIEDDQFETEKKIAELQKKLGLPYKEPVKKVQKLFPHFHLHHPIKYIKYKQFPIKCRKVTFKKPEIIDIPVQKEENVINTEPNGNFLANLGQKLLGKAMKFAEKFKTNISQEKDVKSHPKEKCIAKKILKKKKETEQKKQNPGGIIHYRVQCDGCKQYPIVGCRYKCTVCDNFDYCENCEKKFSAQHGHPLLKIKEPKLKPTFIKCII